MSQPSYCVLASDWDEHCSRNPLHPLPGSLPAGNRWECVQVNTERVSGYSQDGKTYLTVEI